MTEFLQAVTSLPNVHPAIVHFPIALLPFAFLLDVSTQVFRHQNWLDRAAALVYLFGAVCAGGAYLEKLVWLLRLLYYRFSNTINDLNMKGL